MDSITKRKVESFHKELIFYLKQGAVSWLAGTHVYNIVTGSLTKLELATRERHSMDWSYMLDRTIDNPHKCLWVGVFEDTDKDLEMLKYQTGFDIQMMRLNVNKVKYPELTQDDINKIKSLMPMDMYIYEYVKQLHNHRWNIYQKQKMGSLEVDQNTIFNLPSVIQGCKSSRYILKCPNFYLFVRRFSTKCRYGYRLITNKVFTK